MRVGGTASVPLAAYEARKAYMKSAPYVNFSDIGRPRSAADTIQFQMSDETGDTVVGGWTDRDSSVTVFRTAGFNADHPVYKVKMWDESGRTTERRVDLSRFDAKDADAIEVYVWTNHMARTAGLDGAARYYMGAKAAAHSFGIATQQRTNWLNIVNDLMVMRYGAGDMEGFSGLKRYWDALSEA